MSAEPICTVVGFEKRERHLRTGGWHLVRLGVVLGKEHDAAYHVAMANKRGFLECVGGATTLQGAIEQVRAARHHPSVRHCDWDGRIDRV